MAGAAITTGHVVFNHFANGDMGLLNEVETGPVGRPRYWAAGRTGFFTGQNVVVLPDGSLCPRTDPKVQATSFPALAFGSVAHPAGPIVDMGVGSINAGGPAVWFKANDAVCQATAAGVYTFSLLTGAAHDVFGYLDRCATGTKTYGIVGGGGALLEVIDHNALTVGMAAGVPAPAAGFGAVCQYGERLMLSVLAGNRLYFSAAGDFTSWPAANYIDVGDTAPIVALVAARGVLLIVKSGGTDESWWTLRGVPGVNAVLRRTSRFPDPGGSPNRLAVLDNNTVATIVDGYTASARFAPAIFNGAVGSIDGAHAQSFTTTTAIEQYRLLGGDDRLIWARDAMLLRQRGAWTKHLLASGFQTLVNDTKLQFAYYARSLVVGAGIAPAASAAYSVVMVDKTTRNFYVWQPYITRPAFAADTTGAVPDATTCFVTLPEWWVPWGDEVSVKAIMVDFTAWATGDSNANTFTVGPVTMGVYPGGLDGSHQAAQTWSEAAASSSTTGTKKRATFTFAPEFGNGFRIALTGLRGVAIRAVTVVTEIRPLQGVA